MSWSNEAIFYHIYPLGLCGAPPENDPSGEVISRLDALFEWGDHIAWLGANALYLGPLFESRSHGYDIDGVRLDAANVMDRGFLRRLAAHARSEKQDFWLLGEVVGGDYRNWANPDTLDSVTNYEAYKGLYSSHNDANYFEIAYALNRQFGEGGLYTGLPLYNFADNHDVDRIASTVADPAHLYPLSILLMAMPGIPSLYYGSEWGLEGKRLPHSDAPVRPRLTPHTAAAASANRDLVDTLRSLIRIRKEHASLLHGTTGSSQSLIASSRFCERLRTRPALQR